jgi:hypothetical protein
MSSPSCEEIRDLAAAYALDALEPSVAAAVREHLAVHMDAHPEFFELGAIAPALAYLAEPVLAPPALKARILAAAATTTQEAFTPTGQLDRSEHQAKPGIAQEPAPQRAQPAGRFRGWRGAITTRRAAVAGWTFTAAAIVAVVALVVANFALQNQVSNARRFGDQLQRAESLAAAPGSRIAVIAPAGGPSGPAGSAVPTGPNGLAVIPSNGTGVLVMQGLGATEDGQVYEAWAIVGKAAPMPIGSFTVAGNGLGWLDLTVPGGGDVILALTREPGPGATTPTLPIVASGAATARP